MGWKDAFCCGGALKAAEGVEVWGVIKADPACAVVDVEPVRGGGGEMEAKRSVIF